MGKEQKCYMCSKVATSREHVPPLCLFPENKDTKGIDFRKNLITVPSCDLHNSKKSTDDEFLMLSLSGLIKSNPIGTFHQLTKGNRALRRKNKDFIEKEILRNHRYGKIPSTNGKFRIVSIGNPNIERLLKCLKHIAYGLFRHEFDRKFVGEIRVIVEFIEYNDENRQTLKKFLKRRFELEEILNLGVKGANPEVFFYEFHKPDNYGLIGLRTVFYGAAEAYFSFIDENSKEPFNLGMKLIEGGTHTIIQLGEEEFEFNKICDNKK
ncbi:MAG: hypothetical protein DSY77_02990 [Bacteroidetes bacterium]|nr:MAG: hypothetical protein DSY77_02990 [Bacteroidota bacterium]